MEPQNMDAWGGDAVMTLEEAAAFLKVSETTVYQLLREGGLKARKVGREWRVLKSTLVAYLKDGVDSSDITTMPDDLNGGGEYRLENGQERVALWIPLTRTQKKALTEEFRKKDTSATEVVINAFKSFAKDLF
jgi:excisionase family DNA binding protein